MNEKRILIDDIFFQLHVQSSGIARLWEEALSSRYFKHCLTELGISLSILSRSGLDISNGEFEVIRFPTYSHGSPALDALLLDEVCVREGIGLFVSTYFTFPTIIPTWNWCYDLIPEVMVGSEIESQIGWQQRTLAILNCQNFASISRSTKNDLFKLYPHSIDPRNETIAYPWVSSSIMQNIPLHQLDFNVWKSKEKPFILMVGSRHQLNGYKNGDKLFHAANCGAFPDIDIVCVGGEPLTEKESIAGKQFGVNVSRVEANDDELSLLYLKAIAFISLSRYEGFGIPIIESLACGTPVISLANSSLKEAGGDVSIYLPNDDPHSIKLAIEFCQKPQAKSRVSELGPIHAASFKMESSIDNIVASLARALVGAEDYSTSARSKWWRNRIELLSQIEI